MHTLEDLVFGVREHLLDVLIADETSVEWFAALQQTARRENYDGRLRSKNQMENLGLYRRGSRESC